MRFLLILLLLPSCLLSAQTGSLDLITGTWVNEQETGGITRVNVRPDGDKRIVHAWGSCHPSDCDIGETEAHLWNGIPMAIFEKGFATSRVQLIPLTAGRIIVASETEFNDGSGRKDPGRAEFFRRFEIKPDSDEALRARALLRQTAETYRRLTSAHFEAISTDTRTTAKSEVRTVTREKIFLAAPDKVRIEFDGPGESYFLIDDGVSEWRVYPKANEYLLQPQSTGSIRNGPLASYIVLNNIRGDPKIVGSEKVQGALCTIVEITMDHGVTERLWIDNSTDLVRKDTHSEVKNIQEILFTNMKLDEAIAPEFFKFDPSSTNAKNRMELAHEAPESLVGKSAPTFSLHDLDGHTFDLGALRGTPVLLDFWATWCGYCREALPSIELLHRGLKSKLIVIGIDDEEPELARDYLQKYGYTIPTLVDNKDEAVNLYHVNGWPTTVLIDRDGKVVFYGEDFESEKLRDALRRINVW